jgi:hypothetical protein
MGVMAKLFGRKEAAPPEVEVLCRHAVLTPRWDRSEDIGKEDLATGFVCESCRTSFSGEEGRALLQERAGSTRA